MKVAGLQKNSFVDYPGHICAVVFIGGCNYNCWYCHNAQIINPKSNTIDFNEEVLPFLKSRVGQLDAVVFSGGEPTLCADLQDMIKQVKALGFKIKLDTNGTRPDVVKELISLLDFVAMDIKAPWDKYEMIVGKNSQVGNVKQTLEFLQKCGVPHQFRTTKSPDLTDCDIDTIKSYVGASNYVVNQYRKVIQ